MFAFSVRSLLIAPCVLAASWFLLVGAASHGPAAQDTVRRPYADLVQVETRLCQSHGGRSYSECLDEAQGKALIRHAEWIAQLEDRRMTRDEALVDAAQPGVWSHRRRAGTQ